MTRTMGRFRHTEEEEVPHRSAAHPHFSEWCLNTITIDLHAHYRNRRSTREPQTLGVVTGAAPGNGLSQIGGTGSSRSTLNLYFAVCREQNFQCGLIPQRGSSADTPDGVAPEVLFPPAGAAASAPALSSSHPAPHAGPQTVIKHAPIDLWRFRDPDRYKLPTGNHT
jgi:hypothetical protein